MGCHVEPRLGTRLVGHISLRMQSRIQDRALCSEMMSMDISISSYMFPTSVGCLMSETLYTKVFKNDCP